MMEIKDLCIAFHEGYTSAKLTEMFVNGKVRSSDLDKVKEMAVKCMEEYIGYSNFTDEEKEKMKQNHKQWADIALKGVKQRLTDSGKIE